MRPSLRCLATSCAYNNNYRCGAGDIEVVDDHAPVVRCSTYSYRLGEEDTPNKPTEGMSTFGFIEVDFAGVGIASPITGASVRMEDHNPAVLCTARECLYNADLQCTAGQLKIGMPSQQPSQEAACETYRPQGRE